MPSIFADRLKKTRTHVLSKNRIQQTQTESTFIVPRAGADAESELGLFGLLGEEMNVRFGLIFYGRSELSAFAVGPRSCVALHGFDDLVVI